MSHFGEFKDDNGIMYSNSSYKIMTTNRPTGYGYGYMGTAYENMMIGEFDTMYECMI